MYKCCLNIVDIMDGYLAHSSFVHIFINHEDTIARNSTAKVKMRDRAPLRLFYRSVLIINFAACLLDSR